MTLFNECCYLKHSIWKSRLQNVFHLVRPRRNNEVDSCSWRNWIVNTLARWMQCITWNEQLTGELDSVRSIQWKDLKGLKNQPASSINAVKYPAINNHYFLTLLSQPLYCVTSGQGPPIQVNAGRLVFVTYDRLLCYYKKRVRKCA